MPIYNLMSHGEEEETTASEFVESVAINCRSRYVQVLTAAKIENRKKLCHQHISLTACIDASTQHVITNRMYLTSYNQQHFQNNALDRSFANPVLHPNGLRLSNPRKPFNQFFWQVYPPDTHRLCNTRLSSSAAPHPLSSHAASAALFLLFLVVTGVCLDIDWLGGGRLLLLGPHLVLPRRERLRHRLEDRVDSRALDR